MRLLKIKIEHEGQVIVDTIVKETYDNKFISFLRRIRDTYEKNLKVEISSSKNFDRAMRLHEVIEAFEEIGHMKRV